LWYLGCIPLELLKGLNSGLVTAGAVHIASSMAPPGGANTAQGLFSGFFIGLSMLVGGALAWALFSGGDDENNEKQLALGFGITGIILLVFTVLFILKYAFVDKVILVKNTKKA
jgi:MFS family permease